MYSHHATDPCSGLLVNAFDLVRLHMYGDRDRDAKDGTPVNKLPSFVAMSRLASGDKEVSDLLGKGKNGTGAESVSNRRVARYRKMICHGYPGLHMTETERLKRLLTMQYYSTGTDPLSKGKIVNQ